MKQGLLQWLQGLIVGVGIISVHSAFATTVDCQPTGFKFFKNCVVFGLNPEQTQQQLFLLKNRSKMQLTLDHPHLGGSAQAGWATDLASGHWSAIALNKQDFAVTCYKQRHGVRQEVNCQQVLNVCALPQAVFPAKLQGANFWLAENAETQHDLLVAINARGITGVNK